MFAYVCRFLSFSYVNSSTYLILKILSDIIIFFFHLNYVSRYQFSSILFPWAFHMISSYSQGSNGLLFSLRHYFDITCVKDIYRRVISGFLSFARVPERFNHWLSLARSHLIIWLMLFDEIGAARNLSCISTGVICFIGLSTGDQD